MCRTEYRRRNQDGGPGRHAIGQTVLKQPAKQHFLQYRRDDRNRDEQQHFVGQCLGNGLQQRVERGLHFHIGNDIGRVSIIERKTRADRKHSQADRVRRT